VSRTNGGGMGWRIPEGSRVEMVQMLRLEVGQLYPVRRGY
jgi:hypothetical protein